MKDSDRELRDFWLKEKKEGLYVDPDDGVVADKEGMSIEGKTNPMNPTMAAGWSKIIDDSPKPNMLDFQKKIVNEIAANLCIPADLLYDKDGKAVPAVPSVFATTICSKEDVVAKLIGEEEELSDPSECPGCLNDKAEFAYSCDDCFHDNKSEYKRVTSFAKQVYNGDGLTSSICYPVSVMVKNKTVHCDNCDCEVSTTEGHFCLLNQGLKSFETKEEKLKGKKGFELSNEEAAKLIAPVNELRDPGREFGICDWSGHVPLDGVLHIQGTCRVATIKLSPGAKYDIFLFYRDDDLETRKIKLDAMMKPDTVKSYDGRHFKIVEWKWTEEKEDVPTVNFTAIPFFPYNEDL